MSDASLQTIKALFESHGREAAAQFAGLRYEMAARFDASDDRLDAIDEKQRIANGRVTKMETSLARVDECISTLQRAGDNREHRIHELERRQQKRRSTDRGLVSRRDALMFSAGGAAVVGVIKFAVWAFHEIRALL